jgi:hypothetical protein
MRQLTTQRCDVDEENKLLRELLAEGLRYIGLREDISDELEAAVGAWEVKVRATLGTGSDTTE